LWQTPARCRPGARRGPRARRGRRATISCTREPDHVDGPGARSDVPQPVRDGLAGDRAGAPRSVELRRSERELRGEHGGVRTPGPVRSAGGHARALDLDGLGALREEHVDGALAMTAGDDDRARPELEDRAREPEDFRVLVADVLAVGVAVADLL